MIVFLLLLRVCRLTRQWNVQEFLKNCFLATGELLSSISMGRNEIDFFFFLFWPLACSSAAALTHTHAPSSTEWHHCKGIWRWDHGDGERETPTKKERPSLTGKEEPLRLAWKKRRSPRLVVCVGSSFWVSFGGLRIPPFFFFFFYQTGCTHTPTHAEKRDTPIHRSQSAK